MFQITDYSPICKNFSFMVRCKNLSKELFMTTFASTDSTDATQYVYSFGADEPVPPLDRTLLGGKGKGLAEMASIGLPVPPGFILTTEACRKFRGEGRLSTEMMEEVKKAMQRLEKKRGQIFGCPDNPLLVSVRSGARVSMPGMMDTILNLGLNDQSVEGFAKKTHDRLAYDSYRRFISMFSNIVYGVNRRYFDEAFHIIKQNEGVEHDFEISASTLKHLCELFKGIHLEHTGTPFPQDAYEQLYAAIGAVFKSWDSERALLYRQIHHIPTEWGTAVNIQIMVFGNRNDQSATGVGFTRDPATGTAHFYGEFLPNAQGEEVVAGIRTPHPINSYQKEMSGSTLDSLEERMPEAYQQLHGIVRQLEKHYSDMQDIEFTIDNGELFMLQTRTGKRTGFAAIRMAVDMLKEGVIDEVTALKRVQPDQLVQLLAPIFDSRIKDAAVSYRVTQGLNAGPGAASGRAAFSSEKAVEMNRQGLHCILVREEANPDDFGGMVAARGILTLRGGSTSHAAVVARGMGKPCVVGCSELHLNEYTKTLSCAGQSIREGDPISIDGTTGEVYFCDLKSSPSEVVQVLITKNKRPEDSLIYRNYATIMELADKYRQLQVRANADTPHDSAAARAFGAEGIGLCRTEHMFMDSQRLGDVRRFFFSINTSEKQAAAAKLLPYQTKDFIGIFQAMDGLPVTIRLLDPPLHEFMPHNAEEMQALARLMNISFEELSHIRTALEEQNPMLGHRGCRLGVTAPQLTAMQVRAILEAAISVHKEGVTVYPEIMVPLISSSEELHHQRAIIELTAEAVFNEQGLRIPYSIGTMIELPRAALLAGAIAEDAEFFSFGTNDLTQTTFGISRDDSAKFVPNYVNGVPDPHHPQETLRILAADPFQQIDRTGVGELMQIAIARGRKANPTIKLGICGEHGGDPDSVAFCQELGLNYVSCSPYRVPIARLAAAHAALTSEATASNDATR
jgi:pyruvate,orthophosphate dikinase